MGLCEGTIMIILTQIEGAQTDQTTPEYKKLKGKKKTHSGSINRIRSDELMDIVIGPRRKRALTVDEFGIATEKGKPIGPKVLEAPKEGMRRSIITRHCWSAPNWI